ncbi:MAG: hypothetical protein GX663_02035 [Clostridiales bacterium]|nr:hypothetical protein [Clostridiales bacterium]
MFLLTLALLFGIVLAVLLLVSLKRKMKDDWSYGGAVGKILTVLKLLVLVESVAFVILFIIIIVKTLAA